MFAPEPAADHHPPILLFEAGAALRVMSATDVRQHTILLNFRVICLHQRACFGRICGFHIFSLTENLEIYFVSRDNAVELRDSRYDQKLAESAIS